MEKFEILDHTADLKIRAFGKTKEELFSNMVLGVIDGLKPTPDGKGEKREIKIVSRDLNELLVDFLSQMLYFIQTEREVYTEIKFAKLTENELEAELFGHKVRNFLREIKAVTYHGLDVHQNKDKSWEATVLFDI